MNDLLRSFVLALGIATSAQANAQHATGVADAGKRSVDQTDACKNNAAVQYLKLIEAMDWKAMQQRLAKDARYLDPTMAHFDRPAIDLTGADAIVTFWQTSTEESGTSSISYNYTHCFETAGFHVLRYEIAVEASGQYWALEQDRVTIPGQVTSVILIVDDEVTEHRDYVDYAGADRFIEALTGSSGSPGGVTSRQRR